MLPHKIARLYAIPYTLPYEFILQAFERHSNEIKGKKKIFLKVPSGATGIQTFIKESGYQ